MADDTEVIQTSRPVKPLESMQAVNMNTEPVRRDYTAELMGSKEESEERGQRVGMNIREGLNRIKKGYDERKEKEIQRRELAADKKYNELKRKQSLLTKERAAERIQREEDEYENKKQRETRNKIRGFVAGVSSFGGVLGNGYSDAERSRNIISSNKEVQRRSKNREQSRTGLSQIIFEEQPRANQYDFRSTGLGRLLDQPNQTKSNTGLSGLLSLPLSEKKEGRYDSGYSLNLGNGSLNLFDDNKKKRR